MREMAKIRFIKNKIAKGKWSPYLFLLLSLLTYFFLPDAMGEMARRGLAIFVFAVLFWAFEAIDLYATSLWVVVFLSLFMIPSSGEREYELYFSGLANPLILLFFGGFVLAAAVRKHRLDEWMLGKILKVAGSSPQKILVAILASCAFFSFWISNTAAAAMVLPLCQPLLQELSKGDPLRKSLPLAVAFGCNIGGMGTPIGTPPNGIVLGILREYGKDVHFASWMMMMVPLVVILLVFVFFLLSFFYPAEQKEARVRLGKKIPLSKEAKRTASIGLLMIALWLTNSWHGISEAWIALAGAAAFAAFKLIDLQDLQRIDWHVLLLMWGGLALGIGVERSGLLLPHLHIFKGLDEFVMIAGFSFLGLFMSSFINNTATANLLLPFAVALATVETSLIAIPVALSCSLAMALPVSTPPNAIAYSYGTLRTRDLTKTGSIVGIVSLILILAGFQWVIPLFL